MQDRTADLEITVNGTARCISSGSTAADLIEALGLHGRRIALERNGEIVPRGRYRDSRIEDGDRIEIVAAVGGG